jgi:hypothetical protein
MNAAYRASPPALPVGPRWSCAPKAGLLKRMLWVLLGDRKKFQVRRQAQTKKNQERAAWTQYELDFAAWQEEVKTWRKKQQARLNHRRSRHEWLGPPPPPLSPPPLPPPTEPWSHSE